MVEGYPNLKKINNIIKEDEENKLKILSSKPVGRYAGSLSKLSQNSFSPIGQYPNITLHN